MGSRSINSCWAINQLNEFADGGETYPEERIVLLPTVKVALSALPKASVSIARVQNGNNRCDRTYDFLQMGTEDGVVDLDGGGRGRGLCLSHAVCV
jgi:hypothetical protein